MSQLLDCQVHELLVEAEQRLRRSDFELHSPESIATSKPPSTGETGRTEKALLKIRVPHAGQCPRDSVKDTAGLYWYNFSKENNSPQLKRDWQILSMRGLLDPKQHKKALRTSPPKYCRVGEITSALTPMSGARHSRKIRKQMIFDQIVNEQDSDKLNNNPLEEGYVTNN
ncbi:hypothetical protein XA68_11732 [Ophiocordyceps unilateralis]|uniref:Fcf2 pre-rRNA processing C-terminal domain-containing protein n=1 Tax=Ophiocordyceps unilateralis TaxID=268505 RepID=A0A2A9NZ69_OPHUN|nr:hypothetical protein XA68_11732 [Ophiocordyceps unilateralis]